MSQQKVRASHLSRPAYLYVRQSTLKQVMENTESTTRQYSLRQRAVALGWRLSDVIVIDDDLGRSGASTAERSGFQRLVAEVGLGRAGIVMGLEVSRLARNSTDWHRLLEICALTDTLILDEDGVYEPTQFNDRLLLGLKGTMSEAELHLLRSRLRGALVSKARRGELRTALPIGFVEGQDGQTILDPDAQVQESVRAVFRTFADVGSAFGTARAFLDKGIKIPHRVRGGPKRGTLVWRPLTQSKLMTMLHNPRYAGAYFYGRRRHRRDISGKIRGVTIPRGEWTALIPDAHPGYISWQEFESNEKRLAENSTARRAEKRSPPREGPALLQGIAHCGVCGRRMSVTYRQAAKVPNPHYVCPGTGSAELPFNCQRIPGQRLDEVISDLLLETITPAALEVSLAVQQELQERITESDRLRGQSVTRAEYEVDVARQRFLQVDPKNRLVADELESEWNRKLLAVNEAREQYERHRAADRASLDKQQRDAVRELATDFRGVWTSAQTPNREKKRLIRLLIADVTLLKGADITAQVRFRGGMTKTLSAPARLPITSGVKTKPDLIEAVDRLLNDHEDDRVIAAILNEQGLKSGQGRAITFWIVRHIRRTYKLKTRYERLRAKGLLTSAELGRLLDISEHGVKARRRLGRVGGIAYNARSCLYEAPTPGTLKRHGRSKV